MARHSEDECAYCEGDVLPLSYIVGADDQLYCSVKCADAGEKQSVSEKILTGSGSSTRNRSGELDGVNPLLA